MLPTFQPFELGKLESSRVKRANIKLDESQKDNRPSNDDMRLLLGLDRGNCDRKLNLSTSAASVVDSDRAQVRRVTRCTAQESAHHVTTRDARARR